jgi:hypothetical protein
LRTAFVTEVDDYTVHLTPRGSERATNERSDVVTQARGRETDRRIPGVGAPVENGLRGVVS